MISTITNKELDKIKALYLSGMGATGVAKQINRSETFVKYNLKKAGITIRKTTDGLYRKYTVNEQYFDDINTQEKAYWLGFLFADGYNMEQRYEVKLCLGNLDRGHIEEFKLSIGSNQPIKENACNKRDDTCQIVINNVRLSRRLAELGCFQDKSLHLRFPPITEEYKNAFMLGYFDGDGCICSTENTYPQFSVTSSYDFATSYQKELIKDCNLNKTELYDRWKDGRALRNHSWTIRYSGTGNIKKIYPFLYNEKTSQLPYLKRKKDKFDSIIIYRLD